VRQHDERRVIRPGGGIQIAAVCAEGELPDPAICAKRFALEARDIAAQAGEEPQAAGGVASEERNLARDVPPTATCRPSSVTAIPRELLSAGPRLQVRVFERLYQRNLARGSRELPRARIARHDRDGGATVVSPST
jgi:hypothetical protein